MGLGFSPSGWTLVHVCVHVAWKRLEKDKTMGGEFDGCANQPKIVVLLSSSWPNDLFFFFFFLREKFIIIISCPFEFPNKLSTRIPIFIQFRTCHILA